MSDHELPADLARWPADPYRLLGVQFGVSTRDLRRAYLNLVRQFKPEHFPDQFRRIREAYEVVLSHAESMHKLWSPSDDSPNGQESLAEESVAETNHIDQQAQPRTRRSETRSTAVSSEELWELACQGKEEQAYRSLVELHERNPQREEIVLRLYWLLIALPELDVSRSGCDWLTRGLRNCTRARSLLALYRRELAMDPAEAFSERCATLLTQDDSPDIGLELAESRWKAARGLKRWEVIAADLQALRARGYPAREAAWAQFLLAAATQLAWADDTLRADTRRLAGEIESLHLLDSACAENLARLDFQLELAAGLRALTQMRETGISSILAELIPLSWNAELSTYRSLLIALNVEVAHDPRRALGEFDRIRAKAPAILGHLADLLRSLEAEAGSAPDHRTPVELVRTATLLLKDSKWWRYKAFRVSLLKFCLEEAISPELLASAIAPLSGLAITPDKHLGHEIEADWPLRLVYSAWELF